MLGRADQERDKIPAGIEHKTVIAPNRPAEITAFGGSHLLTLPELAGSEGRSLFGKQYGQAKEK
jgi:hypothetical protein